MTQTRLLSDDLVRQLVQVGEVDILVGVPTMSHAALVEELVRVVQAGFATYFPRARTVLIVSEGGSADESPAMLRERYDSKPGSTAASHTLRTSHRITTPFDGVPGKSNAMHVLFASADLLRASTVVVLDAEISNVTPEWLSALAGPIRNQQCDFVMSVHARAPDEGLLVTQLLRPLARATYGWQMKEPIVGTFGCSGPFAGYCLEHADWDSDLALQGLDVWLPGAAFAGGFRPAQAELGPRVLAPRRERLGLTETFAQVVGGTFSVLEMYAQYWLSRAGSEAIPTFGTPGTVPGSSTAPDASAMVGAFASDVGHLAPVLASILSPGTLSQLQAAASAPVDAFHLTDALWASVVFEFLLAHKRSVMRREHVTQALLPLYLGRTASFLLQHAASDSLSVDRALESLCLAFEEAKVHVVSQWNQTE